MTAPSVTTDLHPLPDTLEIDRILSQLATSPVRGLSGQSLLHDLAREGDLLSAELLIDTGADVNKADDYGRQPLHEAAFSGHSSMVSLLLENGANINAAITPFGHTPLYMAIERKHHDVAHILIRRGAHLNVCDRITGQSLLHMAAAKGDYILTGLLISAGIDVFAEDSKGQTACDYAAKYNHTEMVRALSKVMAHQSRYGH